MLSTRRGCLLSGSDRSEFCFQQGSRSWAGCAAAMRFPFRGRCCPTLASVRWYASPARGIRDTGCPGLRDAAVRIAGTSPESRPTQESRPRGSSLEVEREVLILQEGPVSEVDDGIRCLERWHPHGVVVGARKLSWSDQFLGVGLAG